MADADAALKAGDFAKYGEAQQRLKDAITRAARSAAARVGSRDDAAGLQLKAQRGSARDLDWWIFCTR